MTSSWIKESRTGGVLTLALARPAAKNALSRALVAELTEALRRRREDESVRVLVLAGEGADFCAGADLKDMQAQGSASPEENFADAKKLATLFTELHAFPRPTICRVTGNVFGGGVGLVATCDFSLATPDARFALSEVLLGILPAIISPFVVRRIGETNARRLFLTGERFGAEKAREIGLVGEVVGPDTLDASIEHLAKKLQSGSPDAQRRIKLLLEDIVGLSMAAASEKTPRHIADARASKEGQEGLSAFFEKRKPGWFAGDNS